MTNPYYWCRKCHHHLSAHRLVDGRTACEGCDSRHNPLWKSVGLPGRPGRLPASYHEYRPTGRFQAWFRRLLAGGVL